MTLRQLARRAAGWGLVVAGIAGVLLPIIPGVPLLVLGVALVSSPHSRARRLLEAAGSGAVRWREWLARSWQQFGHLAKRQD